MTIYLIAFKILEKLSSPQSFSLDMIKSVRTFLVEKTFFVSLVQRKLTDDNLAVPKKTKLIITLSRQHGCYGAETALELQKILGKGWIVFHREILEAIAKDSGIEKEYLEQFDYKSISWIDELINGFNKPYINERTYLTYLKRFLTSLSEKGKIIVIGRGANFILKDALRVRLVAPLETRVKNLMEINKYTRGEAEKELEEADMQRKTYIKKLFDADIDNPHNYDLIINTKNLSFKEIAKIISETAKVSSLFKSHLAIS